MMACFEALWSREIRVKQVTTGNDGPILWRSASTVRLGGLDELTLRPLTTVEWPIYRYGTRGAP
jgi:hypothetical protein